MDGTETVTSRLRAAGWPEAMISTYLATKKPSVQTTPAVPAQRATTTPIPPAPQQLIRPPSNTSPSPSQTTPYRPIPDEHRLFTPSAQTTPSTPNTVRAQATTSLNASVSSLAPPTTKPQTIPPKPTIIVSPPASPLNTPVIPRTSTGTPTPLAASTTARSPPLEQPPSPQLHQSSPQSPPQTPSQSPPQASTGATIVVAAENISKHYGGHTVLNNITLRVTSGEIFGIIGLSGVGKSTLLNILAGTMRPSSGRMNYVLKHSLRESIGLSTQFPSFYPELTVQENLTYFARLFKVRRKIQPSRVDELLTQLELTGEKNTLGQDLSGGMKKRLDIALALIDNPEVLILDEPVADLDPIAREHIWTLLRKLNARGKTIIMASHLLDELEPIASRVCVLHDKTLLDIGTVDHLRERIGTRYILRLELENANYAPYIPLLKNGYKQLDHSLYINFHTQDEIIKFLKTILSSQESILHLSFQQPGLTSLFEQLVT